MNSLFEESISTPFQQVEPRSHTPKVNFQVQQLLLHLRSVTRSFTIHSFEHQMQLQWIIYSLQAKGPSSKSRCRILMNLMLRLKASDWYPKELSLIHPPRKP